MTGILILAASREGALDPLAQAAEVSHKCLVPIAGAPLITYPLRAALNMPGGGLILISTDDAQGLRTVPLVAQAERQGRVVLIDAQPNLADSIVYAGQRASFPLIVTTADSALLNAAALRDFALASDGTKAMATLALATREAVRAAHPDGQRRFYTFADGAFSNCNLYWLRAPEALASARAFAGGGQFAKRPARIVAAFGVINLLLFRLGKLRLATMMRRISRVFRVPIEPVLIPDGRLAIDVDNARTHAIAEALLATGHRAAA